MHLSYSCRVMLIIQWKVFNKHGTCYIDMWKAKWIPNDGTWLIQLCVGIEGTLSIIYGHYHKTLYSL